MGNGAGRKEIFREIFGHYWHFVQCTPKRNPHNLNAAWRWVVEDWLRCQDWILVRSIKPKPVSNISNNFCSQN